MLTLAELEAETPQLAGLADKYRSELVPALERHELRRKNGNQLATAGVVLGGAGIILLALDENIPPLLNGIGFLCFIAGMVLGGWGYLEIQGARTAAKHVLASLVSKMLGFSYSLKPQTTYVNWFRELSLLPGYDRAQVEDEVSGVVDEVEFVLQEVHLEERKERYDSKGRSRTYYETVFQGLTGVIDFHKSFSSTTIVSADRGLINRVVGWTVPGERVRLESPEFEQAFEVYSNDQVEARYLLTPAFMERAVYLHRFFKGNLEFAFDNGRLLFAANHQSEWMETRGGASSLTDETYVVYIVLDMLLIYHLVDALKLNAKTKA